MASCFIEMDLNIYFAQQNSYEIGLKIDIGIYMRGTMIGIYMTIMVGIRIYHFMRISLHMGGYFRMGIY